MDRIPKSILVLGAYGFIGSAIAKELSSAGHRVTGFGRNLSYGRAILPDIQWCKGDLRQYCDPQSWLPLLHEVDVVINASGVLQSSPGNDVNITQADAIFALIKACEISDISQFIQISACGASNDAAHDFMTSKARADQRLENSSLRATILRPGLVIGRNSYGGTELIRMITALPLVAPRLTGFGKIQCIALADVVEATVNAIARPVALAGSYDLVETESRPVDQIIALHREWLGFGAVGRKLPVGRRLTKIAAMMSDALGWLGWRSPMRSNAIRSLIDGVQGQSEQTVIILGRPAIALGQVLEGFPAGKQDRIHAQLMLGLPLFLAMLALLWLGSGLLGIWKADEAAALLDGSYLSSNIALIMVYGGAVADLILGAGLLFRKTVRAALAGTIAISLAYLAGGTILTPLLWLDPLAPLIKALACTGLSIACLIALDRR
ncbi:SDR family oxidoreductase [uncultured Parasphingorhabdus sp.]|uniref:SDR family oxidoreductase n=1 Tax=uncultured Parasphingorhabdus sp. TaxID=2709694 RepID=UPI002AA808A2|nr:SDR family oxidoreductase [uncultured Parasphingorhabdus sp.]